MNRTMRTLSRTAGMALALSGAAPFVAGQASTANDRAVVVACTDQLGRHVERPPSRSAASRSRPTVRSR